MYETTGQSVVIQFVVQDCETSGNGSSGTSGTSSGTSGTSGTTGPGTSSGTSGTSGTVELTAAQTDIAGDGLFKQTGLFISGLFASFLGLAMAARRRSKSGDTGN
jgi:hypothetical protein